MLKSREKPALKDSIHFMLECVSIITGVKGVLKNKNDKEYFYFHLLRLCQK
jgi:hypothetical protein